MSREIKFRVWDNEKKQMIYPDTESKEWDYIELTLNGEICLYDSDDGQKSGLWEHNINFKKGRFVLEQFTGLKDKNGKEIYEGNITERSTGYRQVIKLIRIRQCYSAPPTSRTFWAYDIIEGEDEVIGDVHTTPKLMEKDNA